MKLQKAIEHRRSIRQFENIPVPAEDIRTILKAALMAPSWKNTETARYYVISNDQMLDEFRENCLLAFNQKNTADAPVLIVETFVQNVSGFTEGKPDNDGANGWGFFDLGLATENLCLEAYRLGYGTLIMGIRNELAIRKMLNIPDEEQIGPVVALGKAACKPEAPVRRHLKDTVHFF